MTKFATMFATASFALALSTTASAAEQATATLHVERGNVMASEGEEFTTAQSGQSLVAGSRLMLAEDSAATVSYANDCARSYTTPGVYVVEADCQKGAAGTTDWAGAAKIVTGVAVGAALLENMEQVDAPPVSR